jgi:hypothetical protein
LRQADLSEGFRKILCLLERAGVKGYWGSVRKEELHDLYSWPNIMRVIKSRGMRWALQVARIGEGEREEHCAQGFFLWGNPRKETI